MTPDQIGDLLGPGCAAASSVLLIRGLARRLRRAGGSRTTPRANAAPVDFLDTPLDWGGGLTDVRGLAGGLLVTGTTGSAKTSATDPLLRELLALGCGAFLAAAKPDDGARYLRLARAAGRGGDALAFDRSPGSATVNLLAGLMLPGLGPADQALNLCHGLLEVLQAVGRGGDEGGDNAQYWRAGKERLLRSLLGLSLAAGEVPTVSRLVAAAQSLPRSAEELKSAAWQSGECCRLMRAGMDAADRDPALRPDFEAAANYVTREVPATPEKSMDTFRVSITNPLSVLETGTAARLVASDAPTLDVAAAVAANKVVVQALSPGGDRQAAVAVTASLKVLFQKELLARRVTPATRCFVLWLDEYPVVASDGDADYCARQRSARGCVVAIAQGLEGLSQAFGGDRSRDRAMALVSNFAARAFFNPTPETADWLCNRLVGQAMADQVTASTQAGGPASPGDLLGGGGSSASGSVTRSLRPVLTPLRLARLRTGGPRNANTADFVFHAPGLSFGGLPFCFASQQQEPL